MNNYCIKVMRHDMPDGFIDINYKWANNEKDAVKLILKKKRLKKKLLKLL